MTTVKRYIVGTLRLLLYKSTVGIYLYTTLFTEYNIYLLWITYLSGYRL